MEENSTSIFPEGNYAVGSGGRECQTRALMSKELENFLIGRNDIRRAEKLG